MRSLANDLFYSVIIYHKQSPFVKIVPGARDYITPKCWEFQYGKSRIFQNITFLPVTDGFYWNSPSRTGFIGTARHGRVLSEQPVTDGFYRNSPSRTSFIGTARHGRVLLALSFFEQETVPWNSQYDAGEFQLLRKIVKNRLQLLPKTPPLAGLKFVNPRADSENDDKQSHISPGYRPLSLPPSPPPLPAPCSSPGANGKKERILLAV